MPKTKEEIEELKVFHYYLRLIVCEQKRLSKTKNRLLIQFQDGDEEWMTAEEYKGKGVGLRFDIFVKKLFAIPQTIQKTTT